MLCPPRHRLVAEYQTAVKAFKACVLALNDLHGFEFDEAYEISEERRVQSKRPREPWSTTSESVDARDPHATDMHTET
jgi:hypothetical protein